MVSFLGPIEGNRFGAIFPTVLKMGMIPLKMVPFYLLRGSASLARSSRVLGLGYQQLKTFCQKDFKSGADTGRVPILFQGVPILFKGLFKGFLSFLLRVPIPF